MGVALFVWMVISVISNKTFKQHDPRLCQMFFEVQGRNMHMKLNICDYVGLCLANEKVFAGFLQWRCHERVYLHKCIMLMKIMIKVSKFIAGY